MSDPLSITASVIACATVGLQSTKLIYDTVSGLCKSRQEFARTDQSLRSLTEILSQIKALAHQPPSTTLSVHSIGNQTQNNEFFGGLQGAVQRCVEDLEPFTRKVERWKGTSKGQSWRRKVAGSIHMYVKNSDLCEIHEVVSRHIGFLNIHLSIAGCKQQAEQHTFNEASTLEINNRVAQISTDVQTSATEFRQNFTAHINQVNETSDRHTKELETGFEGLGRDTAALNSQVRGTFEALQQSLTAEFNKSHDQSHVLQQMMCELQRQLDTIKNGNSTEDLNEQLQDCIDRLYAIHDEAEGDLNIESFEAQLITEDIVAILNKLLDQINLPDIHEVNRKRKRNDSDDEDIDELDRGVRERLTVKRIRGILESSQSVEISPHNWRKDRIPNGRRFTSQNRVFDTPAGSLAISTMIVSPHNSRKDLQLSQSSKPSMEHTFTGTLTLLPKTKRKKRDLKIRAFIVQNTMKNGSFSFTPTLSFHAVIPDDSKVFKIIKEGDLDGLVRILQDGLASLTDCNTKGQSLLGYCLSEGTFLCSQSHICQFLVSKGADVNGWEIGRGEYMVPMLTLLFYDPGGEDKTSRDDYIKCQQLLIEAGADPTARNEKESSGYERSHLTSVLGSLDMELLCQLLNDGRILLDLEQKEIRGMTALLFALKNAYLPLANAGANFVEVSFNQAILLLKNGASALAADYDGYTCLHHVFQYQWFWRNDIKIYRPRHSLTDILVDMIHAGADLSSRAVDGETPSSMARRGNYERSWREALDICGYSPQEVYKNSGVEWIELEEFSADDELIEALQNVRAFWVTSGLQNRQWTPETMQKFLIQGIKNIHDIHKPLPNHSGLSLSHIAGRCKVDKEWREALETCGYDPKTVYARSGAEWLELEDIVYEESEYEENEGYDESEEDDESDNQNSEELGFEDEGMTEDIIIDKQDNQQARQSSNYDAFPEHWPATSQQESYLTTVMETTGTETQDLGYGLYGNRTNANTPSTFQMPNENKWASFNGNFHYNYGVGSQAYYENSDTWVQQNESVATSFFGHEGQQFLDFGDETHVWREEDSME